MSLYYLILKKLSKTNLLFHLFTFFITKDSRQTLRKPFNAIISQKYDVSMMSFYLTFFVLFFFFSIELSPFFLTSFLQSVKEETFHPPRKTHKTAWRLIYTMKLCIWQWSSGIYDLLNSPDFLIWFYLSSLSLINVFLSLSWLTVLIQADHLTRRGKPLPQQESLEIELAEEKPTKRSIITVEELTEIERLEDLDTCMVRHISMAHMVRHTDHWKRSIYFRVPFGYFMVLGSRRQELTFREKKKKKIDFSLCTFCLSYILLPIKGKAFPFFPLLLS